MAKRIYGPRSFGDDTVRRATGKTWAQWRAILDRWNAPHHGHTQTAAHLRTSYRLSDWWAQAVTARYEWDRGIKRGDKLGD